MSEKEIARFLSGPASESHVSASTQNQALNAILFLYREVLRMEIDCIDGVVRATRPHRLPVVLTRQEIKSILAVLDHSYWLMAVLLCGAGLRQMECLQLRVEEIDFSSNQILVRAGKEWSWQWVFPATSHYTDRTTGEKRRHHIHQSVLQKAVKQPCEKPGYPSRQPRPRSGILLPRIYLKMATISAPFKNYLGIEM